MNGYRAEPKVVLHDHLDGGLRPATIVDLAQRAGVDLPVPADRLAEWLTITPELSVDVAFTRFDLAIAVLQSAEGLRRAAREAVEDHAADGVIHAELRFAPLLHTVGGCSGDEVLAAVMAGIDDAASTGTTATVIACAIRALGPDHSLATARLAATWAGRGISAVDLAGPEVGFPAAQHAEAYAVAADAGLGRTAHAGEMDGVASIADAVESLGVERLGHGWRIIDDCQVDDGRITSLGPVARRVRDAGIPLEICLTSNACLGMPVEQHPAKLLADAGFRVTINPDDRSITTTTTSREHRLAVEQLSFDALDLQTANERAAVAAFVDDRRRSELVAAVRDGWGLTPARLVHLAAGDEWDRGRTAGAYVPAAFADDGFIHLSALHQVLTPANAFYRARTDLVALVVDAHHLGPAVVWEPGTGTAEPFPHLYAALHPDAVIGEVPFPPGPDDGFLLPARLVRAVAGR